MQGRATQQPYALVKNVKAPVRTAAGNSITVERDPFEQLAPRPFAFAAKRAFDVIASLLAIIVLSPVFLLIAVLIRLDSPGPAIFKARRIGRRGEPFRILKFRTMVEGAHERQIDIRHLNEAGAGTFKLSLDPRVTRIGSFLRATSLDELPQILNVLAGEMSFVGPRPLSDWEEDQLNGGRGRQLTVRPGITGEWQVSDSWALSLQERVEIEAAYQRSWGFRRDLVILMKTLVHVVERRGI